MKSQLAAVMERTDEPELVKHSTEEISNHSRRYMTSSLEGRSKFSKAMADRRAMSWKTGFAPNPNCYIQFL
jgi:hypothetical protein